MGDIEDEVLIEEMLKQCDFISKYFSGEEDPKAKLMKEEKEKLER